MFSAKKHIYLLQNVYVFQCNLFPQYIKCFPTLLYLNNSTCVVHVNSFVFAFVRNIFTIHCRAYLWIKKYNIRSEMRKSRVVIQYTRQWHKRETQILVRLTHCSTGNIYNARDRNMGQVDSLFESMACPKINAQLLVQLTQRA